jgi:peptidoglycan/LPS O-acetylase OafA/YrhL
MYPSARRSFVREAPEPARHPDAGGPAMGSVRAGYLPAIDGLRAVAVAAVVAYHLALPWARGGFLGVDVFFVLSGFLITGILIGERERRGRIDLGHFYSRRARRLLPALLVVLTVTSVWVGFSPGTIELASFRSDVLAALGYVANWRFVLSHQGYFDQFSTPSPVRHMWSLAIEEQFYVIWPLVLLGIVRLGRGSRRWAAWATVGLAAASFAAMTALYRPGHDPSRVYFGTDTRAFELLVGAVLALVVSRRPEPGRRAQRWLHAAGALGLAGVLSMMVVVRDTSSWMYRGGFLLVALLAAATIWSVSRSRPGPLGTVLAVGPLRWIGRISYGIYLWHWPVIVLLTRSATGLSGNWLRLSQVGGAVGAATVSFYLVERPVRSGLFSPPRICLVVPAALVTALAAVVWATVGSLSPASGLIRAGPTRSVGVSGPAPPVGAPSASPTTAATPSSPSAPLPPPLGLVGLRRATAQDPLRVLIVGDSVMFDASPAIQSALQATAVVRVVLRAAVGFGLSQSIYNWRSDWPKLVAAEQPELVIAMLGGWDGARALSNGTQWYANLTDEAVRLLSAGGAKVLWLEYPHNQPPDVAGQPPQNQALNERRREAVNTVFAESALRHPGTVGYLPLGPALDADGHYSAFLPGPDGTLERVRKHDNIHFCPAGAERVGAWVLQAVTASYALPPADPIWSGALWRLDKRYDSPHGACA